MMSVSEAHNQRVGLPPVFTKNFAVTAVMKSSVLLTWEVPESYKSEVPLKVRPGAPGERRHRGHACCLLSCDELSCP